LLQTLTEITRQPAFSAVYAMKQNTDDPYGSKRGNENQKWLSLCCFTQ